MEETSKHCVLGRHQSCSDERIEVLSDTIERHHPSRNTPSLLYPESCSDGNRRSHIRESICVTSTSSKDFIEDNWMKELGSKVAGGSEDSQQIQPKNKNPIIQNGEIREWTTTRFVHSARASRNLPLSRTHSVTIRKRWSVKWAMKIYSSCAKQYQKCNVLNVFSIGNKEWSTAPADTSWLKANPEKSLIN